ncbi:Bax inhibitor-1 family protein [Armatimonas sp.]|uniref:Bax inhibitor-1/YccA family protein n=1 Tax=Armatimonas sp. TaxID=1872638 RepID=UPI00375077F3
MSYDQFQMQPPSPQGMGTLLTPFVRETYRLFLFGMLGMSGLGVLSYNLLPHSPLFAIIGGIFSLIMWIAVCFGWRKPTRVVLPLFTLATGIMMGWLGHQYGHVFLPGTLLTLGAFTGLTLYAHTTRKDFSYLIGFLWTSFWILLVGIILNIFLHIPLLSLGIAALGAIVMGVWVLFDTSRLLRDNGQTMTPGEAATELLLDIVGLFRWILRLLDQFR